MNLLPFVILAVSLWIISGLLIWSHLRAWRHAQAADLDDRHRDFAWRQFRRRIQASSMLGLIGLVVLIGGLVRPHEQPSLFLTIWLIVAVLVLWLVLLAGADAIATRAHLLRTVRQHHDEAVRFSTEILRRSRRNHNGHHDES